MILECCKQIKYRKYLDGEEICRYGEFGDEFYIIISGEVIIKTAKSFQVSLPQALDQLANVLLGPKVKSTCNVLAPAPSIDSIYEIPVCGQPVPTLGLKRSDLVYDKAMRHVLELCHSLRKPPPTAQSS
jgi:hypothetical protein